MHRRFVMIGSGEVKAHLGYIEDQIDSLILCALAPREKVHLEAFNIASDQPITLNELARLVADYGSVTVPRWHVPVAPVWLAGAGLRAALGALQGTAAAIPPPGRLLHAQSRLRPRQGAGASRLVSRWDNRNGHRQDDRLVSRDEIGLTPDRGTGPRKTDVREGVARTGAWYAEQGRC